METTGHSALSKLIGTPDNPALFRALGAREMTSGLGILRGERPKGWLWSRVAGDMMDMALLVRARNAPGSDNRRIAAALAAVAGVTVVDALCAAAA
jgi:hypothetical protein